MLREPKLKDNLGRYYRFENAPSTGVEVRPQPADLLMFTYLNDHGVLPTPFLYLPIQHLRKDYTYHQKRLKALRREKNTPHGGPYLCLPAQQKNTSERNKQPLSYSLTERGEKALAEADVWVHPKRYDHDRHQLMNGTVTFSIRAAAAKHDIVYATLSDIVAHPQFPPSTTKLKNPLAVRIDGDDFIPDELFGLGYATEDERHYRFFALECDRATETQTTYIKVKFERYIEIMERQLYSTQWGVSTLDVLVLTTRRDRMRNMMDTLAALTKGKPHIRERFRFRFEPLFDRDEPWTVPPLLEDLVNEPWERAELPPIYLTSY